MPHSFHVSAGVLNSELEAVDIGETFIRCEKSGCDRTTTEANNTLFVEEPRKTHHDKMQCLSTTCITASRTTCKAARKRGCGALFNFDGSVRRTLPPLVAVAGNEKPLLQDYRANKRTSGGGDNSAFVVSKSPTHSHSRGAVQICTFIRHAGGSLVYMVHLYCCVWGWSPRNVR